MAIQVVILAAGQGKRMHSALPKVLHPLAARPLLAHVIQTALQLPDTRTPLVVHGHQGELLREKLSDYPVQWVHQAEQLGTGHAVLQALAHMSVDDQVLVLYGDVPLISLATLNKLIQQTPAPSVALVTADLSDPSGYGRVIRDDAQQVCGIVEDKDATPAQKAIKEINTGIYFLPVRYLQEWLPQLSNQNAQREYYLTDIISYAMQSGVSIHTVQPAHVEEILGINDRVQLARMERYYQQQLVNSWLQRGVSFYDPARVDIRGDVQFGHDVLVDINVIFSGNVIIGNHCIIGPNTIIRDAVLADHVEIKANSVIEGAHIARACTIGPYARLRPGTLLHEHVHIGNFVEIKNSVIQQRSKVNHLSYIGDCHMGQYVNVGAGTITCNYDGAHKHKTIIGDHVHIGSDTQLVAPVTIGSRATIGAGATVVKDVPAGGLTLTHDLAQRTHANWQRPSTVKEKNYENS